MVRIALANLPFPDTPDESIRSATRAIDEAARAGAEVVCFPEAFVPGYRLGLHAVEPVDAAWLEQAWAAIGAAAREAKITVVLGTERFVEGRLRISCVVFSPDGTVQGWQDKVQLDPSEDDMYTPGSERRVFQAGELTFGVVICHEGWRYPETVRAAVRAGAQLVFHPHYSWAEAGGYAPDTFADRANTFHEKAMLCRAAENTCYIASVNCAGIGSPTTSAIIHPDATVLAYQPYGVEGLLVADIDTAKATGLLARRYKA